MTNIIDQQNQGAMARSEVVKGYARAAGLNEAERAAIGRIAEAARGQPILDIGVGGGRTIAPLRELSPDYTGVDYTPEMLAVCRARHPDARLLWADARDLSIFPDASFFLVVFSLNGLGMVGHDDRLRVLAEVRRVLRPGGCFLFSTHNQDSPAHAAGLRLPPLQLTWDPARLLMRSARFVSQTLIRLRNHRRLRPFEVRTSEYSIINDVCHDHSTMLYYIGVQQQRRQLVAAGFQAGAEAYDLAGRPVGDHSLHDSLFYIARR